jgi:hypothetical protein
MARDPAQRLINLFAALMACVVFVCACIAGAMVWGTVYLVRHLLG